MPKWSQAENHDWLQEQGRIGKVPGQMVMLHNYHQRAALPRDNGKQEVNTRGLQVTPIPASE